jgi:hypothetical protein
MQNHDICRSYMFLTKKRFAQYIRHTYNRWRSHSSPLSVLAKLVYAIMVRVPAEKHNIHLHTSPLIPQVVSMHLALHTSQECIHVLQKWPQDIPRSLLALGTRSWLVARRTAISIARYGLSSSNPILRGRIRDSYHPAIGYLPPYLGVGALLQKVNCRK